MPQRVCATGCCVDFLRVDLAESSAGAGDQRLQASIVVIGLVGQLLEEAGAHRLGRAEGMVRGELNLKAEGLHVWKQARLNDRVRVDALMSASSVCRKQRTLMS